MLTVVFVRWGNWCHPHSSDYVNRLAAGVRKNLSIPHQIVCFTDDPSGLDESIVIRPLPENLKGWWWENLYPSRKKRHFRFLTHLPYLVRRSRDSRQLLDPADRDQTRYPVDLRGWYNKLYLFKPGVLSGHCLFIDLDTIIVGPIDDLANYNGDLCVLRDFYFNRHYGSGLMTFRAEAMGSLWTEFVRRGCPIMKNGDQEFIEELFPDADFFQDRLPGQVVSYKLHCKKRGVPNYARVVCFHGTPRPHELEENPLKDKWIRGG